MYGHISAAAPLTLADQLPLLMIAKLGWSGLGLGLVKFNVPLDT